MKFPEVKQFCQDHYHEVLSRFYEDSFDDEIPVGLWEYLETLTHFNRLCVAAMEQIDAYHKDSDAVNILEGPLRKVVVAVTYALIGRKSLPVEPSEKKRCPQWESMLTTLEEYFEIRFVMCLLQSGDKSMPNWQAVTDYLNNRHPGEPDHSVSWVSKKHERGCKILELMSDQLSFQFSDIDETDTNELVINIHSNHLDWPLLHKLFLQRRNEQEATRKQASC